MVTKKCNDILKRTKSVSQNKNDVLKRFQNTFSFLKQNENSNNDKEQKQIRNSVILKIKKALPKGIENIKSDNTSISSAIVGVLKNDNILRIAVVFNSKGELEVVVNIFRNSKLIKEFKEKIKSLNGFNVNSFLIGISK